MKAVPDIYLYVTVNQSPVFTKLLTAIQIPPAKQPLKRLMKVVPDIYLYVTVNQPPALSRKLPAIQISPAN